MGIRCRIGLPSMNRSSSAMHILCPRTTLNSAQSPRSSNLTFVARMLYLLTLRRITSVNRWVLTELLALRITAATKSHSPTPSRMLLRFNAPGTSTKDGTLLEVFVFEVELELKARKVRESNLLDRRLPQISQGICLNLPKAIHRCRESSYQRYWRCVCSGCLC